MISMFWTKKFRKRKEKYWNLGMFSCFYLRHRVNFLCFSCYRPRLKNHTGLTTLSKVGSEKRRVTRVRKSGVRKSWVTKWRHPLALAFCPLVLDPHFLIGEGIVHVITPIECASIRLHLRVQILRRTRIPID